MAGRDKLSPKHLALAAVFAAVTALLSQLTIPMPSGVPITLQTLAVALCGCVLGWKLGLWSIGAYLLLGAVGAPVFSSFQGGVAVLFGPTGGFLWGFLALAALCGAGSRFRPIYISAPLGLAGLVLCHLCGAAQYAFLSGLGLWEALVLVSLPYLIKDAASVILADVLGRQLQRALRHAHLVQ